MNLNGNYATGIGAQFSLTTPALNLTGKSNCVVQFQRWLNSDDSLFRAGGTLPRGHEPQPHAHLGQRFGANGIGMDGPNHYDISALADNQPTVYLRWTYRIPSRPARPMSGWNIDDVEISATAPPIIAPPSTFN